MASRSTLLVLSLVSALALLASACGSSVCSGNSCDCPMGQTCDFGSRASGAMLTCEANATCTGAGGMNSQVVCNGTTCTMTVGAGSNITCAAGTCNITCDGACTTACSGTCNTTCGGGTTMDASGCH